MPNGKSPRTFASLRPIQPCGRVWARQSYDSWTLSVVRYVTPRDVSNGAVVFLNLYEQLRKQTGTHTHVVLSSENSS